jgi:tricorn protease
MNLWVVDVDKPVPEKVDSDIYDTPFHYLDPAWSADSQWIAYTKQLRNYLRAAFVYSLAEKKSRQVTDGRSDAFSPRFDRSGKYLFFIASTSAGLSQGWLDMTSMARSVTSSVYAAVLRADLPSPVAPESDEEGADDKAKDEKAKGRKAADAKAKPEDAKKAGASKDGEKKAEEKKPEPVKIDFAGIDQRIVACPSSARTTRRWRRAQRESCSWSRAPSSSPTRTTRSWTTLPPQNVFRFDLKTRKTEKLLDKIDGANPVYGGNRTFQVSADGTKILWSQGKKWSVAASEKAPPRARARSRPRSRSTWTRARSGARCTARSGASSATSSTPRTSTAWT